MTAVGTMAAFPVVRGLPDLGRCRVVGVVNVTPDSFSDGGLWLDANAAIRHGLELLTAGADIIDVGGESTRPGAERVTEQVELDRVLPVVSALAAAGAMVSIDTMRASVAAAAVGAGAQIVNDVSGGLADPDMSSFVADEGLPYVVMHWRGHSVHMQELAVYEDVVNDVCAELSKRVDALLDAGVDATQIVIDPGLGFAKLPEHNWKLLANLEVLVGLGRPVLVGASRKSFLGALLTDGTGMPRPVEERDASTHAVTTIAALAGVWAVRVHDVGASADAVRVVAAIGEARAVP